MFDLIDECGIDLKRLGYKVKRLEKFGISIASLMISSEEDSNKIGLSKGEYYIFNSPFIYEFGEENMDYLIKLISKELKHVLKSFGYTRNSRVLIVGLGNADIDGDRLGKEVFDNVDINPLQKKNNIFKFCPNIFFLTGIDTHQVVKMLVKELGIEIVILIDSLTTANLSRLGTSFQLTTNGMTPGSGVNRFGSRICKESIGVECISLGVPFMINSSALNEDYDINIVLSPKDIKENVAQAGVILSRAINEVIK